MAEHLLVLTTLGNEEDALRVARSLVERRVAACVNITPVRSFYRWKDKLEDDSERLLLIKTRADRFADLETAIEDLHPYDVPELIGVPIECGAAAYLGWVDENVEI